ncbi:hypothetical protein JXC34_01410 [Candidatus Woesearchaeota archaeon]|nr:hypothetical protein [Candidatus Woesearchaeota archaeon]
MSLEEEKVLGTDEVRVGNYRINVETVRWIAAHDRVMMGLETRAILKGVFGKPLQLEEVAMMKHLVFYKIEGNLEDIARFHEKQVETLRNSSPLQLRQYIENAVAESVRTSGVNQWYVQPENIIPVYQ